MYTGISVKHLIPSEFQNYGPSSVGKSIIKRDQLRIPAYNPAPFGIPGYTSYATFRISSPQDFIDFTRTYWTVSVTNAANEGFNLGMGGIHNLFDRIEVRGLGNIQIQEQQHYPEWVAVSQRLYDDDTEAFAEGQSVGRHVKAWRNNDAASARATPFSNNDLILQAQGVTTLGGVAKEVYTPYYDNASAILDRETQITEVPGAYSVLLKSTKLELINISSTASTFNFKPKLSFFDMMFPLFLSKSGLEIRFYFAQDPIIGLSAQATPALTNLTYQVTDMTMWANLVTPHPDILEQFAKEWNSPEGLVYYLPQVRVQTLQNASAVAGNQDLHFQFNVRSARRLLMVMHSRNTFKNSNGAAHCHDIGWLGDYLVTSIKARVGAIIYPNEAVDSFDRIYEHLKQSNGGKLKMTAEDWYDRVSICDNNGNLYEIYYNFILPVDFSKYTGPGAEMSGVDLSTVPVDITINRSATYTLDPSDTIEYVGFLEYDCYLKMSSQQMSRIE